MLAENESQQKENLVLDKRNFAGVLMHLKDDIDSNFAFRA